MGEIIVITRSDLLRTVLQERQYRVSDLEAETKQSTTFTYALAHI